MVDCKVKCRKLLHVFKGESVSVTYIPEEIIFCTAGYCSRWQITISSILFFMCFLHGLNMFSSEMYAPQHLAYYCKGSKPKNGRFCHYDNGTKCEELEFDSELTDTAITRVCRSFIHVCGGYVFSSF